MSNRMLTDNTILAGATDVSIYVTLVATDTGQLKTGLTTSDITVYYFRQGEASTVTNALNALAAIDSAHNDWGFKEVDSVGATGEYRLDLPDAACAITSDLLGIQVTGPLIQTYKKQFGLHAFTVDSAGRVILQATTHTGAIIPTVSTLTGHTNQTGDAFAVVNHATHGNAKLVRSTTPANTLNVSVSGEADVSGASITLGSTERDAIAATLWASSPASESYASDGTIPTLAQFLFMIMQRHQEFEKSGVTITVNKLDGSTPAMVFTLDDATTPNSISRSS